MRALKGRRLAVTPALRRRAHRHAPREDSFLLLAPERALFTGMRRPLREALGRLREDAARVERTWRKLLHRLKPSPDEYHALATVDLAACQQLLSTAGRGKGPSAERGYRLAMVCVAGRLVRCGVPEDLALAAVALYLEACLGSLKRPAEARALVRLTSATQRLVAAGYGEERAAELRRLDDRERQKLAGDLHDEVGADLIVLKLYVEMIAAEVAKGSVAPVARKLREAVALIAHAIESVRRLTLELGPAYLDALGFVPSLRSFVRQYSSRTGIKVALEEKGSAVAMPASHETALYRVLRGALSNVAKHARARHVTVTLRGAPRLFVLSVEDDGKGFDVHAAGPDRSIGFTAMRERVRSVGGRLSIESRSAGKGNEKSGTRIEVRLPLRERTAP